MASRGELCPVTRPGSALTIGAVVRAASGNDGPANWRAANQAGLAGSHINMMFELEEAGDPIGIHIIGNRRTTQFDRLS